MFRTVDPERRPIATLSVSDIENITKGRTRNLWIPWEAMEGASFRHARLDLLIQGGRRVTLLWVPVDDVAPLRDRLTMELGDRLLVG